jgi:alkylation response protein AidB-like acyl-CoA dehydrogenase
MGVQNMGVQNMGVQNTGEEHTVGLEPSLAERARSLAPVLREHRRSIERERRLPEGVVRSLVELDILRGLAPRSVGAPELSPHEMIATLEALAEGDAAAGWIAMVATTTSLAGGYLSALGAREIFGDPSRIACGVFAPGGRAVEVEGGVVVTGRWSFGSGSAHACHILGGFVLEREAERGPERTMMQGFFTRDQVQIVDTWDTMGMRGTGSNDFVATEAFVPSHRLLSLTRPPREVGLTYRFPIFGLLALGVSAVATGIAQSALVELRALVSSKRPQGSKRTLSEREVVQLELAKAEMALRAARALVTETVLEVQTRVLSGEAMSAADRALLRATAAHATQTAAEVVTVAHRLVGSSSIFESSPLAQAFRDVHVATQHAMVAEPVFALAGRVMLGLPTDDTLL